MPNYNWGEDLPFPIARRFTANQPIPPGDLWLYMVSDEAGNTNMAVNGATQERSFRAWVPPGQQCLLLRLVVVMLPGASPLGANPLGFAGRSALPNGVRFSIKNAAGEVRFGDVTSFRTNTDWLLLSGVSVKRIWRNAVGGGGALVLTWPVDRLDYNPHLDNGDYIEFLIRDDLSSLDRLQCLVTGRLLRK